MQRETINSRRSDLLRVARICLVIPAILFSCVLARAQFTASSSGLLQMPSAEMQESGTVMICANYLNKNSLPSSASSGWDYDTVAYGFAFTFWSRLEVGYVCTVFNGRWKPDPTENDLEFVNQDRHFYGRVMIFKEGEFGKSWMPALVAGVSDPTTGSSSGGYLDFAVSGSGNGYFNRIYLAASKHFNTAWGEVGAHAAYQYNQRTDYPLNGPCAAVTWKPKWLTDKWLLDDIMLVLEYDSRTCNAGFIASIWENRFEAMFEAQNFCWINFGLRYKIRLR